MLKKSVNDLFFKDINFRKRDEILKRLSNDCDNSEHLLLYKIYSEIEENKNNNKVFNIRLFNDITKLYENQKDRTHQLFHRFRPIIKTKTDVTKELSNMNVILSFNYGFKSFVATKKNKGFVFNKLPCELNSILKFDNFNAIIYYLNVFINGKLNINIISPYILD